VILAGGSDKMAFLRALKKTGRFIIDFIEYRIASVFLLLLFTALFVQVVMRYVFNNPSPELFEISRYSFIWIIFIGAPLARRFGAHMKFNVIYDMVSRKVQIVFDLIFNAFFTVMLFVTFFPIWNDIIFYRMIRSNVLKIPWSYLLFCFPLFIILMIIHNLIWIYKDTRELITGKKSAKEEEPWD
jgi:TRAP-type C4-dicarboxylate transport system permease small subunit